MCCLLVSGFLTEITQQIHSFRASGVISSHFARATGSEVRTFLKSAGTLCTAPGEIAFLVMGSFYFVTQPVWESSLEVPGSALRCSWPSQHEELVGAAFHLVAQAYQSLTLCQET